MRIEIKDPAIIKGVETIAKAVGTTVEEAAEIMLTASLARKGAWGDCLNRAEPGLEFIKGPEGVRLKGTSLYRSVYDQLHAWINCLILGECLLMTLISICEKANLLGSLDSNQLGEVEKYKEKIENEKAYNN